VISETLADLSLPPINGKAISVIRTKHNTFVVIRVFEDENEFFFQLICDAATSESSARIMEKMGLGQVADRVRAFQAMSLISKGHS